MSIVIDASVALAWCIPDEDSEYANSVLRALRSDDALVPMVWPAELANGLLIGQCRERIDQADLDSARTFILQLPIAVADVSTGELLRHTYDTARRYNLTAYDASYLHLALREKAPLATLDTRLRAAATAAGCRLFG